MSPLFRRHRETGDDVVTGLGEAEAPAASAADGEAAPGPVATTGPWDLADAPPEGPERIDLGALQVPLPDGVELRLDLDPERTVVGITLTDEARQTAMGVNAFAAPRSEGIWAEVRAEIAADLRGAGLPAEEVPGRFGAELAAEVAVPEAPGGRQPVRFLGVDGPRWFLRGLVQGAGAVDRSAAAVLEDAFAGIVVVRGTEAMVARDVLPLRLPREAHDALDAQDPGATDDEGNPLNPFERGPEITETR